MVPCTCLAPTCLSHCLDQWNWCLSPPLGGLRWHPSLLPKPLPHLLPLDQVKSPPPLGGGLWGPPWTPWFQPFGWPQHSPILLHEVPHFIQDSLCRGFFGLPGYDSYSSWWGVGWPLWGSWSWWPQQQGCLAVGIFFSPPFILCCGVPYVRDNKSLFCCLCSHPWWVPMKWFLDHPLVW